MCMYIVIYTCAYIDLIVVYGTNKNRGLELFRMRVKFKKTTTQVSVYLSM